MKYAICIAVFLQAWSAIASHDDAAAPGPFRAPGRLDRMMPRTAGRDCGRYTLNCQGAEGACNNACYHINCNLNSGPNRDRFTYVGPNAQTEQDKNRQQSGCTAGNGGSVCGNYPFSQKFRDPALTGIVQCDEWPMASSIQNDFVQGTIRNSLRCIPGGENGAAGSRIGKFIQDQGNGRNNRNAQCAGVLQRNDYFTVDFDTSTADQTKVKFCLGQGTSMCGSDGYEFALTEMDTQTGKISSPYDPFALRSSAPNLKRDNHYALKNTIYPDLFQCSVELTRSGDNSFEATLFNWRNDQVSQATKQIPGATGSAIFPGLPLDLTIGKTGALGSLITFEYGDNSNAQAAYYKWDSESQGDGRGPATNDGQPLRFCKIVTNGNNESVECYFPCYDK